LPGQRRTGPGGTWSRSKTRSLLPLGFISGPSELYVSYGNIPTRLNYDERSAGAGVREVTLAGLASGGTYHVTIYGDRVLAATNYTLVAERAPFS
jgi:hypothetical protein